MTVYRYWDQAELNRQMSARGTVPDIAPMMGDYARHSAAMRAALPCALNVPYGPTPAERLDYFPATGPGEPIFVFIHGGYWRLLDAADSTFMAQTFVEAGAAVVALNYALAPGASLDEITRQCRAGLAWVYQNAARLNGDPARIHVSGSSAGGHLGGMMLAGGWAADYGLPEGFVQSASLLSGLFDLEPVRLSNCNEWLNLDAAAAARQSPQLHPPARPLPLLIAYAPNETEGFKQQSECYAAACRAIGCEVEIVIEPGTNHFDLPLRFMDREAALTRAALRAMGLPGL
jgi:arylformamidase